MPEIISGKVGTTGGKLYQSLGDEPPRARTALAYFVERRSNLICYQLTRSLSERNFAPSAKEEAVPSIVLVYHFRPCMTNYPRVRAGQSHLKDEEVIQ